MSVVQTTSRGPLTITLRTLTPLWTGGVNSICDRLHETGLIGSLRWWYEALVRGLGGYACDPTSENPEARCTFDSKAYERAKSDGKSDDSAIHAGLKEVCPVCYVFGATGWARLFQLRAVSIPETPLHFRTTVSMNQGWLKRVFGGESRNIDSIKVPFGNLRFQFATRRYDEGFARNQFVLALHVAAEYGAIGARLQHGFGQVVPELPPEMKVGLDEGLKQLVEKIQTGVLRHNGPKVDSPFDLRNFVSLSYEVSQSALNAFMRPETHVGSRQKESEQDYVPCAFDLRYKGRRENWGMRRWLKEKKDWRESDDPEKLGPLDKLMGPRSQWGAKGREKKIEDKLRTASRVFFGMPYCEDGKDGQYRLRIFGFAPPDIQTPHGTTLTPETLRDLIMEYVQDAFPDEKPQPVRIALGKDLIARAKGA